MSLNLDVIRQQFPREMRRILDAGTDHEAAILVNVSFGVMGYYNQRLSPISFSEYIQCPSIFLPSVVSFLV